MLKIFRKTFLVLGLFLLGWSGIAGAADKGSPVDLKAAETTLKSIMPGLTIESIMPSPIPGVVEVIASNGVLYFYPKDGLILLGEIYDKKGHSVTQEHYAVFQSKKVDQIPLDKALKIGDGQKRIIEFTDPDCPFCQKYEAYITRTGADVTRYVFFIPIRQIHPDAPKKAVDILCSEDPAKEMARVFGGSVNPSELKDCSRGRELLAEQEKVAQQFGVTGTPTLVLGKKVISGFQEDVLSEYLGMPNAQ